MKCRCVFVSLAVVMALILIAPSSLEASAQEPAKVQVISQAVVHAPTHFDIALGYSRSSSSSGDFPSIYYSGQTAGDAAGTSEPEALIKQGSGVQFSTASRWDDDSSMALDGADSCTFCYTAEFYPASGWFA